MGGSTIDVHFRGRVTWTNGNTHMTLGTGTFPKVNEFLKLITAAISGVTTLLGISQ